MPEGTTGKPGEQGPAGPPGPPGLGADGKQVRVLCKKKRWPGQIYLEAKAKVFLFFSF